MVEPTNTSHPPGPLGSLPNPPDPTQSDSWTTTDFNSNTTTPDSRGASTRGTQQSSPAHTHSLAPAASTSHAARGKFTLGDDPHDSGSPAPLRDSPNPVMSDVSSTDAEADSDTSADSTDTIVRSDRAPTTSRPAAGPESTNSQATRPDSTATRPSAPAASTTKPNGAHPPSMARNRRNHGRRRKTLTRKPTWNTTSGLTTVGHDEAVARNPEAPTESQLSEPQLSGERLPHNTRLPPPTLSSANSDGPLAVPDAGIKPGDGGGGEPGARSSAKRKPTRRVPSPPPNTPNPDTTGASSGSLVRRLSKGKSVHFQATPQLSPTSHEPSRSLSSSLSASHRPSILTKVMGLSGRGAPAPPSTNGAKGGSPSSSATGRHRSSPTASVTCQNVFATTSIGPGSGLPEDAPRLTDPLLGGPSFTAPSSLTRSGIDQAIEPRPAKSSLVRTPSTGARTHPTKSVHFSPETVDQASMSIPSMLTPSSTSPRASSAASYAAPAIVRVGRSGSPALPSPRSQHPSPTRRPHHVSMPNVTAPFQRTRTHAGKQSVERVLYFAADSHSLWHAANRLRLDRAILGGEMEMAEVSQVFNPLLASYVRMGPRLAGGVAYQPVTMGLCGVKVGSTSNRRVFNLDPAYGTCEDTRIDWTQAPFAQPLVPIPTEGTLEPLLYPMETPYATAAGAGKSAWDKPAPDPEQVQPPSARLIKQQPVVFQLPLCNHSYLTLQCASLRDVRLDATLLLCAGNQPFNQLLDEVLTAPPVTSGRQTPAAVAYLFDDARHSRAAAHIAHALHHLSTAPSQPSGSEGPESPLQSFSARGPATNDVFSSGPTVVPAYLASHVQTRRDQPFLFQTTHPSPITVSPNVTRMAYHAAVGGTHEMIPAPFLLPSHQLAAVNPWGNADTLYTTSPDVLVLPGTWELSALWRMEGKPVDFALELARSMGHGANASRRRPSSRGSGGGNANSARHSLGKYMPASPAVGYSRWWDTQPPSSRPYSPVSDTRGGHPATRHPSRSPAAPTPDSKGVPASAMSSLAKVQHLAFLNSLPNPPNNQGVPHHCLISFYAQNTAPLYPKYGEDPALRLHHPQLKTQRLQRVRNRLRPHVATLDGHAGGAMYPGMAELGRAMTMSSGYNGGHHHHPSAAF
ncbi:hypothetical protein H4R34_001133 [Dimargaris verticillata]|uniref:Uncharacterized protein n=1 Tax=Dimargaris verticillata TaxID=2761393 RepID=A0A9W8BAF6_9FUNG|nr:hypothetical protein H4R34_001133 [Dimargaris verticillata]